MLGEYVTWILGLLLGYAYPAYECFMTIEQNRPDIEQLRFWCQYWIIMGLLTVTERLGDVFVSWLPLYNEAKLAFIIYLWHPKTRGTWYMYNAFFMPFLARHEPRVSRKLQEIRDKSGDLLFFYIKNFTEKGQSMFFELLGYFVKEASGPPPTQGSGRPSQPPPPPPSAPPMPAQDSKHRHRGGRNNAHHPGAEYEGQVNQDGGSEIERFMRDGPFDYLKNDHLRRRD